MNMNKLIKKNDDQIKKTKYFVILILSNFFFGGGGVVWVSYLIFRNNSLNIKHHKTKNYNYFKHITYNTDIRYFVLES